MTVVFADELVENNIPASVTAPVDMPVVTLATVTDPVVAAVTGPNGPLNPAILDPDTLMYDPTGNGVIGCVVNVNVTDPTLGVLGCTAVAVNVILGPTPVCN